MPLVSCGCLALIADDVMLLLAGMAASETGAASAAPESEDFLESQVIRPLADFAKTSYQFLQRCEKPKWDEYRRMALQVRAALPR